MSTLVHAKKLLAPVALAAIDQALVEHLWRESKELYEVALEAEALLERNEPAAALATIRELLGRVPAKHQVANYMKSVLAKETLV